MCPSPLLGLCLVWTCTRPVHATYMIPQLNMQPVKTCKAKNELQFIKLLAKRIYRHLPVNHYRLLPKLLAHFHNLIGRDLAEDHTSVSKHQEIDPVFNQKLWPYCLVFMVLGRHSAHYQRRKIIISTTQSLQALRPITEDLPARYSDTVVTQM